MSAAIRTPDAARAEITRRDPYAHVSGPDGEPPFSCPVPDDDRLARCPSCGAVPGVDRINASAHPELVHPGKGKPCPLPTAPRDRYPGETLARYLAFVEGWYGLRRHLRPGDTVSLILRHKSASGMLRRISPIVANRDGYTLNLDRWAALIVDAPATEAGQGVKVGGCGMDMGFHLVYELSHALYGNGYALRHRWL